MPSKVVRGTWPQPVRRSQCEHTTRCCNDNNPTAGIPTEHHLWVIQTSSRRGHPPLLFSFKWLFFFNFEKSRGQTHADTKQCTQPLDPDAQTQPSTYLHLLIETYFTVAGKHKCVCLCVYCMFVHSWLYITLGCYSTPTLSIVRYVHCVTWGNHGGCITI